MPVQLKRIYDPPSAHDGIRVLVDRLWPRGLTKSAAGVDLWLKEIAPSQELRKWFNHQPDRLQEFVRRYLEELQDTEHQAALERLRQLAEKGTVTLLFSAKDAKLSHASVLAQLLNHPH